MLYTYHSNRMEVLADALAALTEVPLTSPVWPETIVVQSAGMSRWLSMALAQRTGICANVDFVFPAAFVWDQFRLLFDDVPEQSQHALPVLQWRVFERLAEAESIDETGALNNYLEGEPQAVKRFQLAVRIADTFDQYLVYRPDWIAQWESGDGQHWQAEMWRKLCGSAAPDHRAALAQRFVQQMNKKQIVDSGLAERISVFGIPSLAPLYFELFAHLSQFIDVHFFILNPCQEYWSDIVSERDVVRRVTQSKLPADDHYLETGNTLLASWGGQGREFVDQFSETPCEEMELFVDPGSRTMLHCLQSDILQLRHTESMARQYHAGDGSLQVHVCHSPHREVEVLHEQLLALFECLPDLRPEEIVVMTPDVESYAPSVLTVFGSREDAQRIPYAIADRCSRVENPIAESFLVLLSLGRARLTSVELLSLLENDSLARRFRISPESLPRLRRWLVDTNIRWGRDDQHRSQFGVPDELANTWSAGLQRLMLGYAMGETGGDNGTSRLFDAILPQADGATDSQLLGHFVRYAESLFQCLDELAGERTVAQWCDFLNRVLDRFFDPAEEYAFQLQALRDAFNQLAEQAATAAFEQSIGIDVIECWLKNHLEQPGHNTNFLRGGVTFCTMMPMRAVPFRVVCLLGMDHSAFPRRHSTLGFDLMANDRQRGDRSRRADDRYLFLETLLSARDCLYISYVGRSIRDNSAIPPSVLVSELLECVEQGFVAVDAPAG